MKSHTVKELKANLVLFKTKIILYDCLLISKLYYFMKLNSFEDSVSTRAKRTRWWSRKWEGRKEQAMKITRTTKVFYIRVDLETNTRGWSFTLDLSKTVFDTLSHLLAHGVWCKRWYSFSTRKLCTILQEHSTKRYGHLDLLNAKT